MDIALVLSGTGADFALEGGDLVQDAGLRTAVLVSLFSDARLDDTDRLPEGEPHPRGWWADSFERFATGSHLWILERGKLTLETINAVRETMTAALSWMVATGIVDDVRVQVRRLNGVDRLVASVTLERGTATNRSDLWDAIQTSPVTFETPTLQVHLLTK